MKYVSISLPLILVPEEWIFEIDQIRYFWSVIVDSLQSKLSSVFKILFKHLWCVLSFSIVVQLLSHVRLCNPMGCSMPVFHYILEFAQTHVRWVSDAFQPSHPLSPPSPPTLNLSLHQDLFQWVGSSYQVAKVLKLHLHHQSFYEYSGLLFVRIDWFDIFAVQGPLKSLLQH